MKKEKDQLLDLIFKIAVITLTLLLTTAWIITELLF